MPGHVVICLNDDGSHQVLYKDRGVNLEIRDYRVDPDSDQFQEIEDLFSEAGIEAEAHMSYEYGSDSLIDDENSGVTNTGEEDTYDDVELKADIREIMEEEGG